MHNVSLYKYICPFLSAWELFTVAVSLVSQCKTVTFSLGYEHCEKCTSLAQVHTVGEQWAEVNHQQQRNPRQSKIIMIREAEGQSRHQTIRGISR